MSKHTIEIGTETVFPPHDYTPKNLQFGERAVRILKPAKTSDDYTRDHEIAIMRYYAKKYNCRLIFPVDNARKLP